MPVSNLDIQQLQDLLREPPPSCTRKPVWKAHPQSTLGTCCGPGPVEETMFRACVGWKAESLSAEQRATRDHRPNGKLVRQALGPHVQPGHCSQRLTSQGPQGTSGRGLWWKGPATPVCGQCGCLRDRNGGKRHPLCFCFLSTGPPRREARYSSPGSLFHKVGRGRLLESPGDVKDSLLLGPV